MQWIIFINKAFSLKYIQYTLLHIYELAFTLSRNREVDRCNKYKKQIIK